ncbi:MAG: adenylate cyclase, partial [Cyclobacteriaceae bacterium]
FGKNYNEFINQYRIEAFKLNAKAAKNANLTIEGLAYESGFNSKTVFNTYFKKETGLTPKQFMKQ